VSRHFPKLKAEVAYTGFSGLIRLFEFFRNVYRTLV
jgi:hypothetical protein